MSGMRPSEAEEVVKYMWYGSSKEPEYVEPDPNLYEHEGWDDNNKTVTWMRWAKETIQNLRGGLPDSINNDAGKDKTIAELKDKLARQEEAIKGLETWIRTRRQSQVEALEIGTEVMVNHEYKGRIEGIIIDAAGIRYKVVWWRYSDRHSMELTPVDFTVADDILPIPKV